MKAKWIILGKFWGATFLGLLISEYQEHPDSFDTWAELKHELVKLAIAMVLVWKALQTQMPREGSEKSRLTDRPGGV